MISSLLITSISDPVFSDTVMTLSFHFLYSTGSFSCILLTSDAVSLVSLSVRKPTHLGSGQGGGKLLLLLFNSVADKNCTFLEFSERLFCIGSQTAFCPVDAEILDDFRGNT